MIAYIYNNIKHPDTIVNIEQHMNTTSLQNAEIRYFGLYSIALPRDFTPTPDMFMTTQGADMNKI